MRFLALAATLLLIVPTACDQAFTGSVVEYKVESDEGGVASSERVAQAADVVRRRLLAAGLTGVGVGPKDCPDGDFRVYVPTALAAHLEEVRTLAERRGTLELRFGIPLSRAELVVTPFDFEAANCLAEPDTMWGWVLWAPRDDGVTSTRLWAPERKALFEMDKLRRAGVAEASPEFVAARTEYDHALRDSAFVGDQIESAVAARSGEAYVVRVVFMPVRGNDLAAFTFHNIGHRVVIVIEGQVVSTFVVKSKLRGELVIEGGGPNGFTEAKATALAAVLGPGPLPGRLIHVSTTEAK